ncbi:hypothetical protein ACTHSF_15575, partial [Neisseria sp. P0001.S010]|uniref:hypothetical protein n=1 Tax=Neisseria sp. P0001.S010 TaxID=3436654 RepID=UPI003F7D39F4
DIMNFLYFDYSDGLEEIMPSENKNLSVWIIFQLNFQTTFIILSPSETIIIALPMPYSTLKTSKPPYQVSPRQRPLP